MSRRSRLQAFTERRKTCATYMTCYMLDDIEMQQSTDDVLKPDGDSLQVCY